MGYSGPAEKACDSGEMLLGDQCHLTRSILGPVPTVALKPSPWFKPCLVNTDHRCPAGWP